MNAYPVTLKLPDGTTVAGEMLFDSPAAAAYLQSLGDADLASFIRRWFTPTTPITPTAPTTPAGLAATSANPVVLTLATPSTDVVAVSGYEIWRGLSSGNEAKIATSTSFPYTDSSVAPSTTYFYKVRAFDPAGLFSAFSNEVSAAVPGGLLPDTTAPLTPGSAPTLLASTATSASIALPLVSDSSVNSATQVVSGMGQYLVKVNGTLTGSPVSQPTGTPVFQVGVDIGNPTIAGSDSLASGVYTINAGGNQWGGTADQIHLKPMILTGDFDVSMRITSISGGNTYSRFGLVARDGFDPGSLFFSVETFQDPTVGWDSQSRAIAGQASTWNGTHTVQALPYFHRITRAGNVFTGYIGPNSSTWTQINQQTIAMSNTVRVGPAGCASDPATPASLLATGVFDTLSVIALSDIVFNYTFAGSASPAAQQVTYAGEDNAGNIGSYSSALTFTPPATGGSNSVKYNPGQGMFTQVGTALGNTNNGEGGPSASTLKAIEIAALRNSITKAAWWHGMYFWRALNNTQGVIDGSVNGSNLDADYAAVTGYQSGAAGVGAGPVYSAPRRMVIMIQITDYFNGPNGNPTRVMLPDWIANNSAYQPVGPDGEHYGYCTTTGDNNGDAFGYGTVAALWRSSVLAAYESFLQLLANHVLPDGYTVDTSPYIEGVQIMLEMNDLPSLVNGATYGSADPTFTEAQYITNLEALLSAAVSYFPHTSVIHPNNYSETASAVQTLSAYMSSHRVAWAASDTLAYASVPSAGNGPYDFGNLIFQGYQAPANGYTGTWTAGGPVYRGVSPYFGIAQNFDQSTGSNAQIFQMAQAIGMTHFSWTYGSGNSSANTNWLGSATSQTQWNTAPGTWGGTQDAIYNNALTNTAKPSNYP